MEKTRRRINIEGIVQGVGFRPFIFRLANEHNLSGEVVNNTRGIQIEIEGNQCNIENFLKDIYQKKPSNSQIQELTSFQLTPTGKKGFKVGESVSGNVLSASVSPDLSTCSECAKEIFDPKNRRYLYPFTNCTLCGPRFSIILDLPYDRINTSMKKFSMCSLCKEEYENPEDRRFHAQPNACPNCGPKLALLDPNKKALPGPALMESIHLLQEGKIIALKGIGGFQLLVDARNEEAILELRRRKNRPTKPFALMYPDLKSVLLDCEVGHLEKELLISPQSPIVLLKAKRDFSPSISPENPNLGVMLPYSPLHHLLMYFFKGPLVATSGNLSEEPICYEDIDAFEKLGGIADFFLIHDRPIVRPIDDSIVRVMNGNPVVLRRARGYSPLPVRLNIEMPNLLAVGGHLKNTVALAFGRDVYVGQHIGDLQNNASFMAFERSISDLTSFFKKNPNLIIHDEHPNYSSTAWAKEQMIPSEGVQHHVAHFFSCMAEHQNKDPAIGVIWDGSGFGLDGKIWGGEFFYWDGKKITEHIATFRPFPLPGGMFAIKEPRRAALGILFEEFGPKIFEVDLNHFSDKEKNVIKIALEKCLNTPYTTSVGRLFDAIASIVGVCQKNEFEGQAAMGLEFLAQNGSGTSIYSFEINGKDNKKVINWGPMLLEILDDLNHGRSAEDISSSFHKTLGKIILEIVNGSPSKKIFLSGGVFQNKLLLETAWRNLLDHGFEVFFHKEIPPNDGGISLGQIYYKALHG